MEAVIALQALSVLALVLISSQLDRIHTTLKRDDK